MFNWIRKAIGRSKCDIDHEYYIDNERVSKRKITELEDIIKLKETTIDELTRHIEIQRVKFIDKYEYRTS